MKVEVSKKSWSRGKLVQNALLISRRMTVPVNSNPIPRPRHNQMCCLGFACLALGVKPSEMRGKLLPGMVDASWREGIPGLSEVDEAGMTSDTQFSLDASRINDDPCISDEKRMDRLIRLCRDHPEADIQFVFVD